MQKVVTMCTAILLSGLIALTVAIPAKDKIIKKNVARTVSVPVLPDNRIIGGVAGLVPNSNVPSDLPFGANTGVWGHDNQWRFNDRRLAPFVDPITGEITSGISGFANQAGNRVGFGHRGFRGPLTRPVDSIVRPINQIVPINPVVPVNPIIQPIQPVLDPTYPKGVIAPVGNSGGVISTDLIDPVLESGFAGPGVDRRFSGPLRRRIGGGVLSRQGSRQDLLEREAESRRAAIRAARRRSGGKRYY